VELQGGFLLLLQVIRRKEAYGGYMGVSIHTR
jgi:hypothetical protein